MASVFGSEGGIISSAGTAKCVALVLSFCQQHGGTRAEDVASACSCPKLCLNITQVQASLRGRRDVK